MSDWNSNVIKEFRANHGQVGGQFEGSPLVLVHHRGRKSGTEHVIPLMYLPTRPTPTRSTSSPPRPARPTHPDWYRNLLAADGGRVEVGDEEYDVAVEEITGPDRDRLFDEQARRYAGFAEYAVKTAGIRTIPVVALRRNA